MISTEITGFASSDRVFSRLCPSGTASNSRITMMSQPLYRSLLIAPSRQAATQLQAVPLVVYWYYWQAQFAQTWLDLGRVSGDHDVEVIDVQQL